VNEGRFRSDLYYALNVLTLNLPPLRERKEDIESWIDYFLDHYCTLYTRPIQLSRGASRCMVDYPWPGNIRQLENFCHRIVLLTPRRNIDEAFVRNQIDQLYPAEDFAGENRPGPVNRDKTAVKILEALKRHGGNRAETARELGVSKTTLWRLMQKHGITMDYSV
jgi:DNA-binding NtrC family response regulator